MMMTIIMIFSCLLLMSDHHIVNCLIDFYPLSCAQCGHLFGFCSFQIFSLVTCIPSLATCLLLMMIIMMQRGKKLCTHKKWAHIAASTVFACAFQDSWHKNSVPTLLLLERGNTHIGQLCMSVFLTAFWRYNIENCTVFRREFGNWLNYAFCVLIFTAYKCVSCNPFCDTVMMMMMMMEMKMMMIYI